MIYKVNFRVEETGELNNIYVGANTEKEAYDHTVEVLGKEPYSAFVEVIFKTGKCAAPKTADSLLTDHNT